MDDEVKFGSLSYSQWAGKLANAMAEFANPEYQRRVWVKGEGPEVSSYEEALNSLQDFGFDQFLSATKARRLIGPGELGSLVSFQNQLHDFHEAFVRRGFAKEEHFNNPKWNDVVESARNALTTIRSLASSSTTTITRPAG